MQPRFPEGNGFMEVTIAICAILSLLFTTPTNYYEYRHEGNLYYVWVMSWTMSLWWLMRILKPPSKTESPDHMSWRAYVADSLHTGSWLIFYVSYLLFLFYRDVLARQLSTSVIVFYTLIVRFVIVPRLPALTEAERARVADWLQTDARVEKMKQYVNAGPRNASILAHTMANKQHQSCEVCKSTPAFCHFCSDFERDMVSRIYSTWRWNEPEYFNYRFPTQETDLSPGLVSCLSDKMTDKKNANGYTTPDSTAQGPIIARGAQKALAHAKQQILRRWILLLPADDPSKAVEVEQAQEAWEALFAS